MPHNGLISEMHLKHVGSIQNIVGLMMIAKQDRYEISLAILSLE